MRKLYSEEYPDDEGFQQYETDFIKSVSNEESHFSKFLIGRVSQFAGIFVGWVPNETDSIYRLEDNSFSKEKIIIADEFSNILTKQDPFYHFHFPSKGPAGIFPWIFQFIMDYALSEGVDCIIDKLQNKDLNKIGKELSIDWGKDNGDSLGQIEIKFSDGSTFIIENYPHAIERIKLNQIQRVNKAIKGESNLIVKYDAWGRISVTKKEKDGHYIDIEV